jgi:hypothetical protein
MTKASELYKGGRVFFYCPPEGRPVELVILMDGGPLCVGRVYDHRKGEVLEGLYWLYVKRCGAHLGPFFADIHLAFKAMRKIVRRFGVPFFEQPREWLRRQMAAAVWLEKNIGKPDELIGGEWRKTGDGPGGGA